jgi:uncharacterized protein (DUF1015 family)
VSIIKPFRALRPVADKAEKIACVPYDVIYDSEVRSTIAANPLSFLRVTRPEGEFAENEDVSKDEIFAKSIENLQTFINENLLAQDAEPHLYIYRLSDGDKSQTGIVACCSIDEYENGLIKKHEKTRPDKVEDRTAHILALKAQTGLIFLAFRSTDRIRKLIAETVETAPLYDFSCPNCIRNTIWRVEKTDDLVDAFAEVPALYVADGHHRVESANLARKKMREANPNHDGTEEYNFVMAGIFPSEDLNILAYNRVVKDLNGLTEAEFFEKLGENFTITEPGEKTPANRGAFGMYFNGKWYQLNFAVNFFTAPDPIENLDVSILQNYILRPILGVDDPRTNERIAFVGGARGTDELEKMVDEGAGKVAFSMFPTTMEDLFAVSDRGEIMPPKSTWFEPKLKDGLLIHLI